jgi:hypothetical protein
MLNTLRLIALGAALAGSLSASVCSAATLTLTGTLRDFA